MLRKVYSTRIKSDFANVCYIFNFIASRTSQMLIDPFSVLVVLTRPANNIYYERYERIYASAESNHKRYRRVYESTLAEPI